MGCICDRLQMIYWPLYIGIKILKNTAKAYICRAGVHVLNCNLRTLKSKDEHKDKVGLDNLLPRTSHKGIRTMLDGAMQWYIKIMCSGSWGGGVEVVHRLESSAE